MVLLRQTFQGSVPFLDAFWATGESQGVHLGTQSTFLLLSLVPQEHEPGGWGGRGSWWQGTQGLVAEWWGACSRPPEVQSPLLCVGKPSPSPVGTAAHSKDRRAGGS